MKLPFVKTMLHLLLNTTCHIFNVIAFEVLWPQSIFINEGLYFDCFPGTVGNHSTSQPEPQGGSGVGEAVCSRGQDSRGPSGGAGQCGHLAELSPYLCRFPTPHGLPAEAAGCGGS